MTEQSYNQKISYPLVFFLLLMSFPFTNWYTLRGLVHLSGGMDNRFVLYAAFLFALTMFKAFTRSTPFKQIFPNKYSFTNSSSVNPVFRNKYSLFLVFALALVFCATLLNGVLQMGLPWIEPFYRPVYYFGFLICPFLIAHSKRDNIKTVHTTIVVIAIIWTILHLIAFLYPSFYLQIIDEAARNSGTRLGLHRFVAPQGIRLCWMYVYLYGILKFTHKPVQNWKWCVLSSLILFDIMFVDILRRYIISMIFLGGLSLLYAKPNLYKKYFVIVIISLGIIVIFETSSLVNTHVSKTESLIMNVDKTGGNLRINALHYYWNEFQKTNYIGIGDYPDNRVRRSLSNYYAREQLGFYLSDLGIFCGLLKYGFQAIILTIIAYYFMIRDSIRVIHKCEFTLLTNMAKVLLLFPVWQIIFLEIFIWDSSYSYYWGLLFYLYYSINKLGTQKCPAKL